MFIISLYIRGKLLVAVLFSLFILLLSSQVYAAVITGSIYDLSLSRESNVILEINTVPQQTIVSKDGEYTLNAKPGTYTLYAHTNTSMAKEKVIVVDDGEYVLDIILEEATYVPEDLFPVDDLNVSISGINGKEDLSDTLSSPIFGLITGVILIIILAVSAIMLVVYSNPSIRRKVQEHSAVGEVDAHIAAKIPLASQSMDEYEKKMMQMIKKEKRTTQKDLRKIVPLSEAKVSLIISDLENKGKIRKFKKGRGNVIIFVKD